MIALLAFVLGFVQLGAQVLLLRFVQPILGNTTATAAIVLALWLAGLAIGSARAKRDGPDRLWLIFLLGAILVPIGRLALPFAAYRLDANASTVAVLVRTCVATLVLVPIPIAFGAAFVGLARRVARGGGAGVVYGVETLGAATGALAAGFVLPRAFGFTTSLALLAGASALGALVAWRSRPAPVGDAPATRHGAIDAKFEWATGVALFLAGAGVFALEIVATRIAMFFVPGLVSALAGILAGVLLGTGCGALLGAALRSKGRGSAGVALALGGLGVAASLWAVSHIVDALTVLPHPGGGGFLPGFEVLAGSIVGLLLAAPATIASGVAFALLAPPGTRGAGRAYSISCAGCIVGVLLAALDVPAIQDHVDVRMQGALCGLSLVLAALVVAPRTSRLMTRGLALASIVALAFVPRSEPLLAQTTFFRAARDRMILTTEQDAEVVASAVAFADGSRALYTNAFQAASTGPQYGYMRMLGHLPLLLARSQQDVLVIAFGTGTTAGAATLHDTGEIDIVDVSRAVYRLSPVFQDANRSIGAFNAPAAMWGGIFVDRLVADGREFVQRRGKSYDVVTLEPLPPQTPAAVHFYTREFYAQALARLAPGGLIVQWIPLVCVPRAQFQVLMKSFAVECPSTWVFLFDDSVLLVGANELDAKIDVERIRGRMRPQVVDDLALAHVGDVAQLLAAFVCGRACVLAACGAVDAMTDDRPSVALGFGQPNAEAAANAQANAGFLLELSEDVTPWLAGADSTLVESLRAADRAEDEMLRARAEPERELEHVQKALAAYPDDAEAKARLGARPRPATVRTVPDHAAVLADALANPATSKRALAAAGSDATIPLALLVPFLAHAERALRLEAMVALQRRGIDMTGYDPDANSAELERARERIRKSLP